MPCFPEHSHFVVLFDVPCILLLQRVMLYSAAVDTTIDSTKKSLGEGGGIER
jgi:hypothetical protein